MHSLGIKLLAVFYFCAGGFIGELVRRIYQNRSSEFFGHHGYLWTVIGFNVVALIFLALLLRRALTEPPLQKIEKPARGLPTTNRVAFLLFTTSYGIGLLVGLLFT
jgi:hypothetical protein